MKKHLLLTVLSLTAMATAARAQYVLGSFQSATDPTDAGWVDPNNGYASITQTGGQCSFATGVVPGYAYSLAYDAGSQSGTFGYPSLQLDMSADQMAAFASDNVLTFTVSVASNGATTGAFQIYNLGFQSNGSWGNANLYSAGNGSWPNGTPIIYLGVKPVQTMTVTVNYGSEKAAILAGATTLNLVLQGNVYAGSAGGNVDNVVSYWNNVYLSVPEPTTTALMGVGIALAGMLLRRRKA